MFFYHLPLNNFNLEKQTIQNFDIIALINLYLSGWLRYFSVIQVVNSTLIAWCHINYVIVYQGV